MRRVREHVDHAGCSQFVARLMHQQAGIARQRGGVAADVDDAFGRLPVGRGHEGAFRAQADALLVDVCQRLGQRKRTLARRIDQPLVGHTVLHQHLRRHLEQVARHELRGRQRAAVDVRVVGRVVLARARHQRLAAFDAQHLARLRRQRQREIAQAAEPVDHAFLRLHLQALQCTAHQHAVDVRVDLREIGRAERHGDTELGQAVAELRRVLADAMHRIRPLGLQPPLHARVCGRKCVQLAQVALAERLQMAQHQRGHMVAAGQFDLRAGVACIHAGDQRAQRQQQIADVRRQDGAALHVGDVAALALVEADQHLALLDHMAHRQARAPAVAPVRPMDGAQQMVGLALAQMPEVVFQHALLHRHLGSRVQMLHLAAAASPGMQPEMRTTRRDALGGLLVHGGDRGCFPGVLLAVAGGADPFVGQGALDEDDLAVGTPCDALGVQIQGVHQQPVVLRVRRAFAEMRQQGGQLVAGSTGLGGAKVRSGRSCARPGTNGRHRRSPGRRHTGSLGASNSRFRKTVGLGATHGIYHSKNKNRFPHHKAREAGWQPAGVMRISAAGSSADSPFCRCGALQSAASRGRRRSCPFRQWSGPSSRSGSLSPAACCYGRTP